MTGSVASSKARSSPARRRPAPVESIRYSAPATVAVAGRRVIAVTVSVSSAPAPRQRDAAGDRADGVRRRGRPGSVDQGQHAADPVRAADVDVAVVEQHRRVVDRVLRGRRRRRPAPTTRTSAVWPGPRVSATIVRGDGSALPSSWMTRWCRPRTPIEWCWMPAFSVPEEQAVAAGRGDLRRGGRRERRAVDEEPLRGEPAEVVRPGRRAAVERRVDLAEDDERLVGEGRGRVRVHLDGELRPAGRRARRGGPWPPGTASPG